MTYKYSCQAAPGSNYSYDRTSMTQTLTSPTPKLWELVDVSCQVMGENETFLFSYNVLVGTLNSSVSST